MNARVAHQARLPIAALAVLALLAFVTFSALRPTIVTSAPSTAPTVTETVAQRPQMGRADYCADGTAYVTGDLVGDASPLQVYKAVCP